MKQSKKTIRQQKLPFNYRIRDKIRRVLYVWTEHKVGFYLDWNLTPKRRMWTEQITILLQFKVKAKSNVIFSFLFSVRSWLAFLQLENTQRYTQNKRWCDISFYHLECLAQQMYGIWLHRVWTITKQIFMEVLISFRRMLSELMAEAMGIKLMRRTTTTLTHPHFSGSF